MNEILRIKDLNVSFQVKETILNVLENVNLVLEEGSCLGIVGESGCGKTTLAMSIVRLLPQTARIKSGKIIYRGNNLLDLSEWELHGLRGSEIAYIFQDPVSALNPVISIGEQLIETIINLRRLSRKDATLEATRLLSLVSFPEAIEHLRFYPHQLSGGLNQRVMIAIALATNAKILIADEPTSNLDVTIEASIVELLKDLQVRLGLSIIFITHDLSLVKFLADKAAVMHRGRIVEFRKTSEIFTSPQEIYTRELLQATSVISGA